MLGYADSALVDRHIICLDFARDYGVEKDAVMKMIFFYLSSFDNNDYSPQFQDIMQDLGLREEYLLDCLDIMDTLELIDISFEVEDEENKQKIKIKRTPRKVHRDYHRRYLVGEAE